MSTEQHSNAIVLERFGDPVRLERFPVPEPGRGAVLAHVDFGGVCGTDVHLQAGRLPIPVPVVLGHEGVGRVAALGEGVERDAQGAPLSVGDRIAWASSISCGACFYCRDVAAPTLCESRRIFGINRPADSFPHLSGSWADAIHLDAGATILRLDDATPSRAVIALGCAGPTAVHGLVEIAPVRVGETVLVQGAGPVGLASAMYAHLAGAGTVILAGAPTSRLERARALGVGDVHLDIGELSAEARLQEVHRITGGRGADLVVECTGVPTAVAEGIDLCRPGGRYLVLGQYTDHGVTPINPHLITRKQLQVFGSWAFSAAHYGAYIRSIPQLVARFDIGALVETFPLSRAQDAIDAARSGEIGKAALVPDERVEA
jgi:threonine dehydrogenase-like Zn-dependent dehydrogenase